MALLVGIDEAGFGPILGPLVVSCCGFTIPQDRLPEDLWHMLRRSVCQTRRKQNGRLLITDSKKAHSKSAGLRDLERTALAALTSLGQSPSDVAQLLSILCPDVMPRLNPYPWYQDLSQHPLDAQDEAVTLAAHVFQKDMKDQGMEFSLVKSLCLDVGTYNHQVQAVRNKARVLLSTSCSLIQFAWQQNQHDWIQVVVDRQGGRMHYRATLQRFFPDLDMHVQEENDQVSRYRMTDGRRTMDLSFQVKADAVSLPVSLASMISKWVRELLIIQINRYWQGFCHDIKPTAGYWQDGTRFIEEIRRRVPQVPFNEQLFIRCR